MEITCIIDPTTGDLTVDGLAAEDVPPLAGDLLPLGREVGCARPLTLLSPPVVAAQDVGDTVHVRIAGYYHNSVTEGPGRRSSVLFQSCPLRCPGCWVPQLHSKDAGILVPVDRLATALLHPAYERDGISILGGEAFVQPEGLLALIRALRARGCAHILCYSGYTYQNLCRRGRCCPAILDILDDINVLVDGRYVAALAGSAGPWTGSGNQRVIDMVATRRADRVVLFDGEQTSV